MRVSLDSDPPADLAPRGQTPIVRHRYRRDKISAISAVTVSAQRRRVGLYIHFHPADNITHVEVFLRAVLRHLRGHVIVLLDGGSIHMGPDVQALRARCPGYPRRPSDHALPDHQGRPHAAGPHPLVYHGLRAPVFFVSQMSITYAH
jgi:hypothetical protein